MRWLVLLARVKRRVSTRNEAEVAALLAEAAALAPANGWPELQLIVRTERALALDADASASALLALAQEAGTRLLHSAELGAWLHLAHRSADPQQAATAARQALHLLPGAEALHADRALRWLAPARALAAAGDSEEADTLARAGQDWLRNTATVHVAPEFGDSFLHQHPSHRSLLAWPSSSRQPPAA